MIFGVDYYPEHWSIERMDTDLTLMEDAGITVVRLAEFAWDKMEATEGAFDFEWLDRVLEALKIHGIKAVLSTPTATPPKWLIDKHPDILQRDRFGRVKGFGSRKHYCALNTTYHDYTKKIVTQLVQRYADHPTVISWQIDNEFGCHGHVCYCDQCKSSFQEWLHNKYGEISELNQQWGTYFWSQTYNSFDEVIHPIYTHCDDPSHMNVITAHNPGLLLDYQRFQSDAIVAYQQLQIDLIRAHSAQSINHNMMGGHFSELDYYDLGADLDFVTWDNYITLQWGSSKPEEIAMNHEIIRGVKNKNFWVMEQQSGPCGWNTMGRTPRPGQIKLWAHQALAHGAEGIVFFRWRACTVGIEQYWHGVLDHDGIPRRRYEEVKSFGHDMSQLEDYLSAEPISPIAIIKSFDNVWSHHIQPHSKGFDYNQLLQDYYSGFYDNNHHPHVLSIEGPLSTYPLVVMPGFNLMTEAYLTTLETYVQAGGILLTTFRSGTREWNNSMTTRTQPGYFQTLAGIELEEFDPLNSEVSVPVEGVFGKGQASLWCDILKPLSAETLATYAGEFYQGKTAITRNRVGKGYVYYVGCDLNPQGMASLMDYLLTYHHLQSQLGKMKGLEKVTKSSKTHTYTTLLNHTPNPIELPLTLTYSDAYTGNDLSDSVVVEGYDVKILRHK